MYKFLIVILSLVVLSCQQEQNQQESAVESPEKSVVVYPAALQKGLDAHGGLDRWQSMQSLAYTFSTGEKTEHHIVDLKNRKVRIENDQYTLGFDGKEVWVTPDKAAFGKGSPRFYHNLYFYFFAMPYVLADPGIKYKVMAQQTIEGKQYNVVSIKYQANVGDAPDDEYIVYFDQSTNRMEYLFYTVTYYSKGPGEKYNMLHYHNWQEVDGLWLPRVMSRMDYSDGIIGEKKYDRTFTDVELSMDRPNQALFEMPEGAEIDSLK